ncbi:MAG TPA: hypothetical protein GX713_01475 [Mollicutes bacterium]|nr:hypothetical protein [Mollicutes bacterium]
MEKVPKMVSTKDLSYISDMFNWHIITAKKYELFLNKIEDEECEKMLSKLIDLHYQICDDLTKLLKDGDS